MAWLLQTTELLMTWSYLATVNEITRMTTFKSCTPFEYHLPVFYTSPLRSRFHTVDGNSFVSMEVHCSGLYILYKHIVDWNVLLFYDFWLICNIMHCDICDNLHLKSWQLPPQHWGGKLLDFQRQLIPPDNAMLKFITFLHWALVDLSSLHWYMIILGEDTVGKEKKFELLYIVKWWLRWFKTKRYR